MGFPCVCCSQGVTSIAADCLFQHVQAPTLVTKKGLEVVTATLRGMVAFRPCEAWEVSIDLVSWLCRLYQRFCRTESCLHMYLLSSRAAGQPERMWAVVHICCVHRRHPEDSKPLLVEVYRGGQCVRVYLKEERKLVFGQSIYNQPSFGVFLQAYNF